jgi:hypothetical protein
MRAIEKTEASIGPYHPTPLGESHAELNADEPVA